ncbi:MAG: hypothetical protein Q8K99_04720 [Actinomycetota bacterium]|nr:hypothetical protein [Actinomycetota bacterium]
MARSAKSANQRVDAGAAALAAGGVVLVLVLVLGLSKLLPVAGVLLLVGAVMLLSANVQRGRGTEAVSSDDSGSDAES